MLGKKEKAFLPRPEQRLDQAEILHARLLPLNAPASPDDCKIDRAAGGANAFERGKRLAFRAGIAFASRVAIVRAASRRRNGPRRGRASWRAFQTRIVK
jgi:hypothetical protein